MVRNKKGQFIKGCATWNKGLLCPEEVKRKISKAKKKHPTRFWSGKKRDSKTREKISNSLMGRRGAETGNWKGGVTPKNKLIRLSIQYRLWREAVFARDNWTCQKCFKRGSIELHPHHIKNFAEHPKLRFAIDNGITFCIKCHKKFHKVYKRRKNNKAQLKEYLK